MSCATIPPILANIFARIAAAVPGRARATFLDLLLGAAVSKGGHVTDALLLSTTDGDRRETSHLRYADPEVAVGESDD